MGTFRFQTLDRAGALAPPATIDAASRGDAIRELVRRGLTPVQIEENANGTAKPRELKTASAEVMERPQVAASPGSALKARGRRVGRAKMAMFIRELSTAQTAGLPLIQSLRTIERQERNAGQREMLAYLISQLEAGISLADAAAGWGSPFNDLTVNMIRAGEASGRLSEVLTQAADLMDRDVKLRRSVVGATAYPGVLAALILVAIVVIVQFIVPRVLKSLGARSIESLPWPTRVVQSVSGFFTDYWWIALPMLALGVIFAVRAYRMPESRLWIDERLLGTPVVGRLLQDVAVARFTRTLATLTASGLPVLTALRITKGTLGNRAMEQVVDGVVEQISAGKSIAEPLERSQYFPPMLAQIVALGERSGRLEEMLARAANAYEERTETSLKLFTTLLPPVLVVTMAMVVGFIILAIILPMLQLQESLGK